MNLHLGDAVVLPQAKCSFDFLSELGQGSGLVPRRPGVRNHFLSLTHSGDKVKAGVEILGRFNFALSTLHLTRFSRMVAKQKSFDAPL